MNQEIKITNEEWRKMLTDVDKQSERLRMHDERLGMHTVRLDRHRKQLDALEDAQLTLPTAIQKAVKDGMAPIFEKVMYHDKQFAMLELEKERKRADDAETAIEEAKERKRWLTRLIIGGFVGVLITSVIGGVISFYVAVLLNNMTGG